MAYKYNEKTGEFERVPDVSTRRTPERRRRSVDFWEGLVENLLIAFPIVLIFLMAVTCS